MSVPYLLLKDNMRDIKILKPGELGHGIMIESDAGYINPDDIRNKEFISEIKNISTAKTVIAEPLVLYVILQKYGVVNHNGRIYPEGVLKREANKYQELINERRSLGELNHPEDSVIDGDRISHGISEMWWEGQTLMGKIEIIMSPGFIKYGVISCKGDQVANLLRLGYRIGVSSRGIGSLKQIGGKNIVQDDFEIICWDVVTTPSTSGSWIFNHKDEAKMYKESKETEKPVLIEKLEKFLL